MVYTSLSSKRQQLSLPAKYCPPLWQSLEDTYGDNGNILMLRVIMAEKLGAHVTVDIVSLHDDFDENHYDIAFSVVAKTLNKGYHCW